MQDLELLHGDLGFGGDESVATGINNHGEIVGFSNYARVYKNKKIKTESYAVIWKNGKPVEFYPNAFQASQALAINNEHQVLILNQYLEIYDLVTNKVEFLGETFTDNLMNGRGGILLNRGLDSVLIRFDQMTCGWLFLKAPVGSCIVEHSPANFWAEQLVAKGFNNKNKIVGSAKNCYGETHAVLLTPIK